MTADEAKWFIDHRCAVAHRGGRSVLYAIQEVGDSALVEVEAGVDFSALQFFDYDRRVTVRHTGLHKLLNGDMISMRMSWPLMMPSIAPLILHGKWGGVLLHREQYPKAKPMTRKQAKVDTLMMAYGGRSLNMNNYETIRIGVDLVADQGAADWARAWQGFVAQMAIPRDMIEREVPVARWRMNH